MKFTITMKDPDGLYEGISETAKRDVEKLSLADDEKEALLEIREQNMQDICNQWFKNEDYLTVEIDTEKNTCTVLPAK